MLPLRARMDLEAMAIIGCSVFTKAPASLGPQIVYYHIQDTRWEVLPLCKEAIGVFYIPSRQGKLRPISVTHSAPKVIILAWLSKFFPDQVRIQIYN